jgi:tetratricopeptide (TPR) repeat protein
MFGDRRLRKKLGKYKKRCLEDPSNISLQIEVAKLHRELGELENAVDGYHQTIQILRKSEGYPLETKVSDWVVDIYRRILAISPFDEKACQGLGEEYCIRYEFSRALDHYNASLQKFIHAQKYHEALTQCVNILVLDPGNISVRETRASLFYRLGMMEKCALELKEIAALYLLQNKNEEALSCYFKALELTPLDRDLREKLSKLQTVTKSSRSVLTILPEGPGKKPSPSVPSFFSEEKEGSSKQDIKGTPLEAVRPLSFTTDNGVSLDEEKIAVAGTVKRDLFDREIETSLKKEDLRKDPTPLSILLNTENGNAIKEDLKRILESREQAEKFLAALESSQSDENNQYLRISVKQKIMDLKQQIIDLEKIEMELRGQIRAT